MKREPAEAFAPGEYIAEEVAERGWTEEYTATRLRLSGEEYRRLLSGKARLTPATAMLCGALFGTSEVFWVHLEMAWRRTGGTVTSIKERE